MHLTQHHGKRIESTVDDVVYHHEMKIIPEPRRNPAAIQPPEHQSVMRLFAAYPSGPYVSAKYHGRCSVRTSQGEVFDEMDAKTFSNQSETFA